MTSLDGINGGSIQTLLRGENDSNQSDEFQAYLSCPWRRYPNYRGCFDAQGFLQRRNRLLQLALLFPVCNQAQTRGHNREEKLLRHVAMVAKFLDYNKPKIHLKSKFALFQTSIIDLIQFHLICQMLAKLFCIEFERTVSEFRKRIQKLFVFRSLTP